MRLYVNYFQPSLKLRAKKRNGGRVTKYYDKAKTPYKRLMESDLNLAIKKRLADEYKSLDPLSLLAKTKELQEELWMHAQGVDKEMNKEYRALLRGINKDIELAKKDSLKNNLKLIELEKYRASRKRKAPRDWRSKEDAFKDVWHEVEIILEAKSETTGTSIMDDLIEKYPDKFHIGQLRTLQRRISCWKKQKRIESKLCVGQRTSANTAGIMGNSKNEIYCTFDN